jgi:pyridoxal phosphate enzyme (YggS family)
MAINLEKLNDKILSYNAKLLPVVKNRSNNEIKFIYDSNFRDFGENRLDDFYEHSRAFKDVKYHFIAPIQSRKLKEICNSFTYIHTVTRNKEIKLLESFDFKGEFFIQMNLDNDPNKNGIDENSLNNIIEECFESNLFPCGLMTIPNINSDPKKIYSKMEQLNNNLKKEYNFYKGELSMGMSGDFEVALDYGSTIVRIGTKLFDNV